MNKKEFLKTSDESILDFGIANTINNDNKTEICAFLVVGHSHKYIQQQIEGLSEKEIKDKFPQLQQFEVILTKKELQYLLNRIEQEEQK